MQPAPAPALALAPLSQPSPPQRRKAFVGTLQTPFNTRDYSPGPFPPTLTRTADTDTQVATGGPPKRSHAPCTAEGSGAGKAFSSLFRLQQFSALTEVLFHFLTEPKEVEKFLAQLSEFAATNQISLGPLRSIVKSLLLVPNGALKKSLTAEQVRADFITLGLSEEKATYFSEKWKQNAPTLARWAIGQTLMINQLIDMEWKFGGILSCSIWSTRLHQPHHEALCLSSP
ncbi:COMM domain-containing protein 7 [Camelus ferus]|nr:COMM domain-containing protein 7 [Camelus ferus]